MQIDIGDPQRDCWTPVDALVHTGASISSAPASILHELGVIPLVQQNFRFGQGEVRSMDVGQTWIRVEDKDVITLVLFNEEDTQPLLGALALEGVFVGVDPVGKRLLPVEGLMMHLGTSV